MTTTRTVECRMFVGTARRRIREDRGPHVARVDGQNRVRDQGRCPLTAPCRLNDENLRGRVQNVHGQSSAEFSDALDYVAS